MVFKLRVTQYASELGSDALGIGSTVLYKGQMKISQFPVELIVERFHDTV